MAAPGMSGPGARMNGPGTIILSSSELAGLSNLCHSAGGRGMSGPGAMMMSGPGAMMMQQGYGQMAAPNYQMQGAVGDNMGGYGGAPAGPVVSSGPGGRYNPDMLQQQQQPQVMGDNVPVVRTHAFSCRFALHV